MEDLIKQKKETEAVLKVILEKVDQLLNTLEKQEKITLVKFNEEVKAYGNGAHIPIPKKYLGRIAAIRILKKKEEYNK